MGKRVLDLIVSGAAILALMPLLIPVILILSITGEREIFYRQERIGRGGKPFYILKFATMLKDSPNLSGGDITVAGDPRILPFGRFLRKTKINELPQLFNVLKGDMSLIGYRPLTPRVAALFPEEHWKRLSQLRPGLSGVGSIVFRDEERLLNDATNRERVYREVIAPHKAELERWYAERASIMVDLKLIALTLFAIIWPEIDTTRFLSDLPPMPAALRVG